MKTNLLPNLTAVELVDKQGKTVSLQIKLYEYQDQYVLMMADSANGVLARNAGTLISQLVERFELPVTRTRFYRHIYLPHQGSVFGSFQLGWGEDQRITHYTFAMMAPQIDDLGVRRVLKEGQVINLRYGAPRKLSPAV